ncbi:MAG: HD domain-containing protein [Elusimicrobiales bacterium]|nr:HD domain-containing protein [Elusimicrobiales bacterium]
MKLAARILRVFPEAWLVGGALRDALRKKPFKDIDLAVPPSADFRRRVERLAGELDAACFLLDEETQVWRLTSRKKNGLQLDIMPFVGGSLKSDLARRDFTVNALACRLSPADDLKAAPRAGGFTFKPARNAVTDLFGGLRDLKAKKLVLVSPGVFAADPVRLLRAFRIASAVGLAIAPAALKAVKKHAPLIRRTAQERVREELLRLLESPESHRWLALMHQYGLLTAVFPDLAPQETCATAYYGKGGVLKHTLLVLQRMDYLFENLPACLPQHKKAGDQLPAPRLLKFAALLHDIAKPPKAAMIKGRLRFFGHEEFGAQMTQKVMEDLRFSRDEIRLVTKIIGAHLRPGNLAANDQISDRAMFRFFRTMGEHTVPLLALSWADHASYISEAQLGKFRPRLQAAPAPLKPGLPYNSPQKTLRYMQVLNLLFRTYVKKSMRLRSARLIDGNDVIKTLRVAEGPRVGELLDKVQLLQFEGKVKTREQALKALKGMRPGS